MNIIEKIKEFKRKLYLRYITGNMGDVTENDDKIICYVKENKIEDGFLMNLSTLSKEANLNKKICYIYDNITANKRLNVILQDDSEIIIKDCDFKKGLQIVSNGKCVIDNSYIKVVGVGYNRYSIVAKEIELKNIIEDMINLNGNYQLGICAKENLTIKNCNILFKNCYMRSILLIAENDIYVHNSRINCSNISIDTSKICTKGNVEIICDDSIKIYTDDFDNLNIITPLLEINGVSIDTRNKKVTLRKITDNLEQKRLELIDCLKELKDKVNEENQNRLNDYQKELENKPIKKLMK